MIVSFDGLRSHTLPQVKNISNIHWSFYLAITIVNMLKLCPQLEDYLLSLGWKFLEGNTDSSSTVDLTVRLKLYAMYNAGFTFIFEDNKKSIKLKFCWFL